MHSTFLAGCLVSGVGEAMCVPVALPSGFPRGYGPIPPFTDLHYYTPMPGIGRCPFAFGFLQTVD